MPPKPTTPAIALPPAITDEICDAARKTGRSTAFIVARAVTAGKGAPPVPMDGPHEPLFLESDDDDPPSALATARKATPAEVAACWTATRARFAAWIAREVEAQKAERADDLDAGLRDAADPKTPPARMAELARSEYVRVRTTLLGNPALAPEALAILAADKDRVVREALENRKLAGK